jgi:HAE1 family hydrophobic/amphiphilic exporter-1
MALVVLGYTSFNEMSIDLMPDVDFPFVTVLTIYPGAGAEAVESEVSKKIEDAINPISGMKHITSYSQEGYSFVFAEFVLERDPQEAAQEVREKVSAIRADLPNDIEAPVIARYDPQSAPIMSLTIAGERPVREITTLAKDEIQKRLEAIPGVGAVVLVGGFEREVNVWLDIGKMESYELTIDEVKRSLAAANLEIPGGRVNEDHTEYLLRTMGKLVRVADFGNIAVANPHGQPVYLKDIAVVIDGVTEQRSLAKVNGEDAVTLDISKQSGANTVAVAQAVKGEVAKIQNELPPDIRINIVVDNSTYIEDSIHDVLINIYYGGLLAILVIFLFLADIRSTIISAIAIPTSIIATFTFMNALGFTLNILSLMGLSLAVGLLIDDAIVVIENIFRHLDGGEPPFKAAFQATKEIGLAVMATTFSIVVVFLPVAFMQGIVGQFFYQFGMTVAFSVIVSLFIAFTLTPMLSSRFLRKEGADAVPPKFSLFRIIWRFYRWILKVISPWNRFFNHVNVVYKGTLRWALGHRLIVVALAIGSFVMALFLGGLAGSEFMPQTDEGKVVVSVETPPGTDLATTSARMAQIEELISKFQGIDLVFTTIGSQQSGVNEGTIYVKLVDKNLRPLSAQQMVDSVRKVIAVIPGVKIAVMTDESEGGGSRQVEVSIRGNDLNILTDLSHKVENVFRQIPGAVDLTSNLEENKPELKINIDRALANDLGINVYQVASTIRSFVDGEVVTRYKEGDKEYDVRVRLKESDRAKSADIGRLMIASNKEVEGFNTFMVPLSHIAQIEKSSSIGQYNRYDRLREIRVGCNVALGYFAGTAIENVMKEVVKIDVPPGYSINKTGYGEMQEESFGYIFLALGLAVIFVYLLLASQFESFFDPFSIMFSLPMSLVGAIIALLVFGNSISIMSLIGIIMLMGLVTKNAILLIDFIKQNRYKGISRTEAILIAGPVRLRPILMTTFAMVFGMLPLMLGLGPGAELRAPMARAVVGGVISSTLLTLIVVPIVYTLIDDVIAFILRRETIQVHKEDFEDDGTINKAGEGISA